MKKALITGSNGFIGSQLAEKLKVSGYSVKCMVRKKSNLKWMNEKDYEFVCADFTDIISLPEAVSDVDEIYHLGGIVRAVDNKKFYDVLR